MSIMTQAPDAGAELPVLRRTTAEKNARGAYVAVVELPGERIRRRVYLTLAAAEKAVRRAQDRGHGASVVLCRLEPVARVVADDAADTWITE